MGGPVAPASSCSCATRRGGLRGSGTAHARGGGGPRWMWRTPAAPPSSSRCEPATISRDPFHTSPAAVLLRCARAAEARSRHRPTRSPHDAGHEWGPSLTWPRTSRGYSACGSAPAERFAAPERRTSPSMCRVRSRRHEVVVRRSPRQAHAACQRSLSQAILDQASPRWRVSSRAVASLRSIPTSTPSSLTGRARAGRGSCWPMAPSILTGSGCRHIVGSGIARAWSKWWRWQAIPSSSAGSP